MVTIKVKKIDENVVLPKLANETDAGFDVTATSVEIKDGKAIYGLGFAVEIPDGYCMKIYPRSSISKKALRLTNNVGVVDSGYRGEVKLLFDMYDPMFYNGYSTKKLRLSKELDRLYSKFFLFRNKAEINRTVLKYMGLSYDSYLQELYDNDYGGTFYRVGDRIGQAIIEKLIPTTYIEVEELDVIKDRKGGFGSTGR